MRATAQKTSFGNNAWRKTVGLFWGAAGLLLPLLAAAQDDYGAGETCRAASGGTPCNANVKLEDLLGGILGWLLGLLGFVFLMLIIWGGIGWMTAGGNEEKVTKSKHMITAAIGGLVVTFISFALADAIVGAIATATGT